mgnify:CR=1 FL=1
MGKELVQKTNLKREIGWMYFLDKEGDICRGKMGALIQVNPAKYAKPEKVIRLGIKREKCFNRSNDRLRSEIKNDPQE